MTILILAIIKNILKLIVSKASVKQLAAGFSFGLLIGLTPGNLLYTLLIVLIVAFVNINIGTVVLGVGIVNGLDQFAFPLAHRIGYYCLTQTSTTVDWITYLHNLPVVSGFQLNNTVQLGTIILGLCLWLPIYGLTYASIHYGQVSIKPKLAHSRWVQRLQKSLLIQWVFKLKRLLRL